MTLGIDISRLASQQKTGVEWYVYFLLRELRDIIPTDVEVRLYTLEDPVIDFELPEHFIIKTLSWPPKRLWTQIRLSFEMLVHPPDVLFVPSHVIPIIHPKQTVTTIHDIASLRFPQAYNWFERWYSKFAAKQAAKLPAVLTPSQFTKDELLEFTKVAEDRVTVTPLGFEVANIHDVALPIGVQKPFLLTVGRIEEKKNTRRVVEAFSLLKKDNRFAAYQLVLAGKPGYGYEAVQQAIAASPYREDIVALHWVEPDVLGSLYVQAELFVFPSLYEGFGIPILEAYAAGTPVLTSSGTSTEEVGGSAALYVDPLSVDTLAAGMKLLLTNTELRQAHIRQGRERALEYNWKKTAEGAWQVLNSLVC